MESEDLTIVPESITVQGGELISFDGKTFVIRASELEVGSQLLVNYEVAISPTARPGQEYSLSPSLTYASLSGEGGRVYASNAFSTLMVNSSTIAGQVFIDANQDGIEQYEDLGLGGILMTLTGEDHLGNEVLFTTEALPSGYYEFANLRSGTYHLSQQQPEGIADGFVHAGDAGGLIGSNEIRQIVIPLGAEGKFDGYRFTESPLSWIDGTVYFDMNENGELGIDERGIGGVIVELVGVTNSGQNVSLQTTTNERGYYVFSHLQPGTYSIIEGAVEGYFDAADQLGTNGGEKVNDAFHNVVIDAENPGQMYNFGEYAPGAVEGQIYIDYDRDEVLDRRDGLLAGVQVSLDGINDLGETIQWVTATDLDGNYTFSNLRPGTYQISSPHIEGLDAWVSNLGVFLGGSGSVANNGNAVVNGFENIRLSAGAQAVDYNIGHEDLNYDPSIGETEFESQIAFHGTDGDDTFEVTFEESGATIVVNGKRYELDASQTRSIRLLATNGYDSLEFTGSENKETIDLRKHSTSITGTWFETLVYGMESVLFEGGGHEDLARFYDSDGDDIFQAEPMNASMVGEGFVNSVRGVHRIYAYFTEGTDRASLIGQSGRSDNYSATPTDAKLYGSEFYLYARGYDSITASATDANDRAYLYGSEANDRLTATFDTIELAAGVVDLEADGYAYAYVSAKEGGVDTAELLGTDGDDQFKSRPTEATLDRGGRRVIAKGFEFVDVYAGAGEDQARFYDSHYEDRFDADASQATITNRINRSTAHGFDKVYAYMNAGGKDKANIGGSGEADVFKAAPDYWKMEGGGSYLFGTGFTEVLGTGDENDKAYLYDSDFDDVLEVRRDSVTMQGQQFSNRVQGFGTINSEANDGNDRVRFFDDASRSTVRFNEAKATVFGSGLSYNVTGFDALDAYYQSLEGRDNVELDGRIDYDLLASDIEDAIYKLSLVLNPDAEDILLKSPVAELID